MEVLVTGGAGFIGCNLVRFLVEQRPDWNITVVDALTYSGNVLSIEDLIRTNSVEFVHADICNRDAMVQLFEKKRFTSIFHLAAESHVDRSIQSSADFVKTNVLGTDVLLAATRSLQEDGGLKPVFVHISTDEVYGTLGETGVFTEDTPLDPTSPYAASKAASDVMALSYYKTFGLDVRVTRCTNNYGPYQFPEKFIPLFITNALEGKSLPLYGDGLHVRSWLHVRDHARALLSVLEQGKAGEVYNLGPSAQGEVPNIKVAQQIVQGLGADESLITRVQDRLAHDRRYAVDPEKAERELGWRPLVEFSDGLSETIQWYREQVAWWKAVQSGEHRSFIEKNYGARGKAQIAAV